MKACKRCLEQKDEKLFGKDPRPKDRLKPWCRPCVATYARERRAAMSPEVRRAIYSAKAKKYGYISNVRNLYGMSIQQVEEMRLKQGGKCKICHRQEKLGVDHCHTSGMVRGLLCMQCNMVLGRTGDSISRLESMIDYLRAHQ